MEFWVVVGLSLLIAVAGLSVPYISRRAASGRLKRNHVAGIRIPATMASDEAWVAGHKASIPFADAAGVAGVLTAIVTPIFVSQAWWLVIFGGSIIILIFTLVAARKADVAAKAVNAP